MVLNIDLCSGAGGFSYGFVDNGSKFVAVDNWDVALASYKANIPNAEIINMDVKEILKARILSRPDNLLFSPPCLVKDELVMTSKGQKPIQDVQVGDLVLTHKGNYKKVLETKIRSYSGEIYKIWIQGNVNPLICTGEHPIFVKKMRKKVCYWRDVSRKCNTATKYQFSDENFIEAKDLTEDYLVGFPINKREKEYEVPLIRYKGTGRSHEKIIPMDLPFKDTKFWFFIGFYLAEGWFRKDRPEISIAVNEKEKDRIIKLINSIGINKCAFSECEGSFRISFYNQHLYNFVQMFGDGAKNKFLPVEIENMPKKYLKALLWGWIHGDGYFDVKRRQFNADSISLRLIEAMQRIVIKVYGYIPLLKKASLHNRKHIIEGREVNSNDLYNLTLRSTKKRNALSRCCHTRDHVFSKIKCIEKVTFDKIEVFNLSVEDDESFCKHLFATHNCQPFSKANPKKNHDISVIEACLQIRDELRPRIWIMEEVVEVAQYDLVPVEYITRYKCTDVGLPNRRERLVAGNFPRFFPTPFKQITINGFTWKRTLKTPIAHMRGIGHGKRDYRKTREDYRDLAKFLVNSGVIKTMPKNPFDTDVMKWLLGFPMDYKLFGDKLEQQLQVGNAVSPAISRRIWEEIKKGRTFQPMLKLVV